MKFTLTLFYFTDKLQIKIGKVSLTFLKSQNTLKCLLWGYIKHIPAFNQYALIGLHAPRSLLSRAIFACELLPYFSLFFSFKI